MTRARPADRRTGFAIDFHWNSTKTLYTVGFSLDVHGRCAEVFLNIAPSGGDIEKAIRDAAILASFALQHGSSLDALLAAVTHEEDGTATSVIGVALDLVRGEILRMGGFTDEAPDPGPLSPVSPIPSPSGNSGGGIGALVLLAKGDERPLVRPADAKELQNDGDTIRRETEIWPICERCSLRHPVSLACDPRPRDHRLSEERRHSRVFS